MMYHSIRNSLIYHYVFALFMGLIALLLIGLAQGTLSEIRFIFFIIPVIISARQGGLLPGLLCGAVSGLGANYLFVEPRYVLFPLPADSVRFIIVMLLVGLISWLEERRNSGEKLLRDIKEELEVILNGLRDGITAYDASGRIIFANTASADLMSQLAATHISQGAGFTFGEREYRLINDEGKPVNYMVIPHQRVFETSQPVELTFGLQSLTTAKNHWFHIKSTPVFDNSGKVRLAVNILQDITKNRDLEMLRAENEERLRKLLDNLSAFVGIMTPDGILLEANRSALQAANLQPEDVLGKPFEQTYWWAYNEDVQANLRQSIQRAAQGETVRYDVLIRLGADHYITIDFMLAPVLDNDGRVEYLLPSGIDVTLRNQLTTQVRMQQLRLEAILNSVPGIVYEGLGGNNAGNQQMNYVSQYAEQMLGYPMSVWKEASNFWQQVIHPDDWGQAVHLATENLNNGNPAPVPFRCITADGRVIHTESYSTVITDLEGRRIGSCGIVLDVTERRRNQDEISRLTLMINEERQRLASIISNVPGVVYETVHSHVDPRQRTAFVSAYIEKMLGYSPDECIQDPDFWQRIIVPEDLASTRQRLSEHVNKGEPGMVTFRCVTRDDRIVHVESHFSVIDDAEGNPSGTIGVMMDITERRQIEEAITEYAEDLRRSNEELEQFAYIASHDLQEPLRMVTSYLQLIEQRYASQLDDDAREFIGFAVDGGTRMKSLINDLLTYSRIQRSRMEFEAVLMEDVLEEVLYNLKTSIEEVGAIITYDPLPEINANPIQMNQLFQNLLTNALKFRTERTPQIHIGVRREGNQWHFTVADNGIGIESEYLDRIFLIFQRLHARSKYPGTGIGLAICKKIVDKHGGNIYVESTPGEGTTFHFRLPVKRIHRRTIRGSSTNSVG